MSWLASRNRVVPRGSVSVTLSDPLVSVERSGSVDVTVTIQRSTMAGGNATVEVTGLPTGVTASVGALSTTTRKTATCVVTLSAASDAPVVTADGYTVRVTLANGVRSSALGSVTVPAPAPGPLFVLSVQSPVNLVRGASVDIPVSMVRSAGFTASVAFSLDETLPTGVSASFTPSSTTGLFSVLTLTATESATLGPRWLTVRGAATGSDDATDETVVTVIGAGAFAHLAPAYTLPLQENGEPMTFDVDTGQYGGTVFDTSWLTRSWLLANADTVVTMKASGGDYGLTEMGTALQDAATRNDLTVIVVDSGAVVQRNTNGITGVRLRAKGTSYADANWTVVVPSAWWDGTWNPTGDRYPDLRLASGGGAEEQQYMWTWQTSAASSGEWSVLYADENARKYAFIGCYAQPHPDRGLVASAGSVLNLTNRPEGFIWRWGVVDAGFRLNPATGEGKRGARCVLNNGARVAFESSMLMRNFFNGGENNAFSQVSGSRTKIVNCFIESDSIGILIGGGQPAAGFHPENMEFRRNYMVKGQHLNQASADFGFPLWTTWVDGAQGANVSSSGWRGNKQHLEIKFGRKILIEGNVVDTNFTSAAGTGTGISVQLTAQGGTVSGVVVEDITVANNFVTRCTKPFYLNPYYNTNQDLVPDPSTRVAVLNNVFMRGRRAERDANATTGTAADLIQWRSAGQTTNGTLVTYGPFQVSHNTWVVPNGEPNATSFLDWRFVAFPASNGLPVRYDFEFTKNLFPNRWINSVSSGGIKTGDFEDFTGLAQRNALAGDRMVIADNGIPTDVPNMTRAAAETTFPDQYEPAALWQAQGDNPWGWEANVTNPFDCDFSLASGSPLKGIAADGTDPGVAWSVLQTAISGVRQYAPEDIPFTDSIGIQVEFTAP